MTWYDVPSTPISSPDDAGPVRRRLFEGKPHALTFLADGALVVGSSHGLRLYDAQTGQPIAALIEVGGVRWMVPHPDGVSVIAHVRSPKSQHIARVWLAQRRVVMLLAIDVGYGFHGGVSPDGATLAWLVHGEAPVLQVHDTTTGEVLRKMALPNEANRASSIGVRADGVLYVAGDKMLLVHPDGRIELRADSPFFRPPNPLIIEDDGGIIAEDGDRVRFDGTTFTHGQSLPSGHGEWYYNYDRSLLIFLDRMDEVKVWDRGAEAVVFKAAIGQDATGSIPGWQGQGAAASATHVAAIGHGDASVLCWRRDAPAAPCARITGSSQGIKRLMFHGERITAQTCQPPNTLDAILEIQLDGGATRRLKRSGVHGMARTPDGARLVVLHDAGPMQPCEASVMDADGQVIEVIEVQRGGEQLVLSADGAAWGAISHTSPGIGKDPTCFIQWRAFGAARWAKTLKLKGYWPSLALGQHAAIAGAGGEAQVVSMPKGKALHKLTLSRGARACAVSPSGERGVIVGHGEVSVVHIPSGALAPAPYELPVASLPTAVCFLDDDTYFVGYDTGAITRHHAVGGAQTGAWFGHTDEICTLVIHQGRLWSGSADGTAVEWGELD